MSQHDIKVFFFAEHLLMQKYTQQKCTLMLHSLKYYYWILCIYFFLLRIFFFYWNLNFVHTCSKLPSMWKIRRNMWLQPLKLPPWIMCWIYQYYLLLQNFWKYNFFEFILLWKKKIFFPHIHFLLGNVQAINYHCHKIHKISNL